jgi:hypothetical protein
VKRVKLFFSVSVLLNARKHVQIATYIKPNKREQRENTSTYSKYSHSFRKGLSIGSTATLAAENLPSKTGATGFRFLLHANLLLSTFQQLADYAVGQ